MIVDIQFVERGGGDSVRLVYEPTRATETRRTPPSSPSPPAVARHPRLRVQAASQPFNQRPDAELNGLNALGIVVEDLSASGDRLRLEQGRHRNRPVGTPVEGGLESPAQRRRGHLPVRAHHHDRAVERTVRVAVRRLPVHAHHRDAVLSGEAGAGPGGVDAQRQHDRQRTDQPRRRPFCGRCRSTSISSSMRISNANK